MMPICTMLAIAVALASVLVAVAQPLCNGSINSPREDFTFVPSQSTEPTFCPGTSYPGSMDSLSIDDPRSWVFTPMGTAAGTAAETSGTYSITGPLGLLEACRLSDPPQSLVISVDQQRLDGIFGEATVTFTSGSGSTTTFVVSYAPGGFHIIAGDEFMVDPTDLSAPKSLLSNVWNATGLVRPLEAKLCERMDSGQLANATRYFAYQSDSALGCQTSGSRRAVSYSICVGSEAIANPRTYTLVLLWTPDVNCPRCECGDCSCASEVSDPVVVQVMETGGTTSPPTTITPTTPTSGEPSSGTEEIIGIAIGGGVAVIVLVAMVTLSVVLCYWWHKRKKKTEVSGLESGHEMTDGVVSIDGHGGGPGKKVSSHDKEDSIGYEPEPNQKRIIAVAVDRLIEVKTDWLEGFTSALATRHQAKVVTPSFTSPLLRRELDEYLLNENCDCLYVLLKGSLEQHRQNGTTDSSHVPIERIVLESYLHHSNCEKLVLVQFEVTSPLTELVLANGARVVNFADIPPDDAPGDRGGRYAEDVFRSVWPMLRDKERERVLAQAQDRTTRVTPSEQGDIVTSLLVRIADNTQHLADHAGRQTEGIHQLGETSEEILHVTRETQAQLQRDSYSPSQAAITTED